MKDAEVQLFIINSSIQVIADQHRFEKWANFPVARQRLLDLIVTSKKNVLIISGDRHISEFSQIDVSGLGYSLTDFTSSGLTHTWSEVWEEKNSHRVGELIIQKTFGIIKVDWSSGAPKVVLQSRGLKGAVYGEHKILFPIEK
jgi:alkaline phosphatase D